MLKYGDTFYDDSSNFTLLNFTPGFLLSYAKPLTLLLADDKNKIIKLVQSTDKDFV